MQILKVKNEIEKHIWENGTKTKEHFHVDWCVEHLQHFIYYHPVNDHFDKHNVR